MVLEFANSSFVDKSYELRSRVKAILPHCNGLVLKLKHEGDFGFSCLLRTTIDNKYDAMQWIKDFQALTNTEYRVNNTFAENTSRIVFKKKYYCDRNIRRNWPSSVRHRKVLTGCKSRVNITVKQPDMKRSKDKHLKDYPCEIFVHFMHNHAIVKSDKPKPKSRNLAPETLPNSNYFDSDILENCEIYYICEEESRESDDSRSALCEELKGIFKSLKDKVINESSTYLEPVRKFVNNFNNLSTNDNNLVSALRYFGEYSNFPSDDDYDDVGSHDDGTVTPENEKSSCDVKNEICEVAFEFDDYENEIVFTSAD